MPIILIICTILVVAITVLPLSHSTHWIIRGMDFPRLQIAVFSIVLLIAIPTFLGTSLALVLIFLNALCLIWQLSWILPYSPLWKIEVESSNGNHTESELSIIASNVLTPNRDAPSLIKLVNEYKPDILITLESDKWWEEQLSVLESDMPYTVKCPLDNLYGMHLYSKLPLHDEELSFLVEKDVPSIHASIELRSGDKIQAHFLHPAPPAPTENSESKERDAELIIVAKSVANSDEPVIVTGDLNDVAWSPTTRLFRKISGLLDPRIGRGTFNTFHVKYPFLRWPLDHLFHSEQFALCSINRLPSIGSDHFPLFIKLSYNPINNSGIDKIKPDQTDHERAEKITDEKNVLSKDVPEPNAES